MALPKVTVKLGNPAAPEQIYEALFLVDTGATDCSDAVTILQRLLTCVAGMIRGAVGPPVQTPKRRDPFL